MIYILILISVYLICSLLSFGIEFAHWQRKYPEISEETYWSDFKFALTWSILGPISLVSSFLLCKKGKHGLKFW